MYEINYSKDFLKLSHAKAYIYFSNGLEYIFTRDSLLFRSFDLSVKKAINSVVFFVFMSCDIFTNFEFDKLLMTRQVFLKSGLIFSRKNSQP